MRFARLSLLLSAGLLAAGCSTLNSGNAGTAQEDCSNCCCCNAAQVAVTYSAPVVLEPRVQRQRMQALLPAPTLPCAPGYCPMRAARRDRN